MNHIIPLYFAMAYLMSFLAYRSYSRVFLYSHIKEPFKFAMSLVAAFGFAYLAGALLYSGLTLTIEQVV